MKLIVNFHPDQLSPSLIDCNQEKGKWKTMIGNHSGKHFKNSPIGTEHHVVTLPLYIVHKFIHLAWTYFKKCGCLINNLNEEIK